MVPMNWFAVHPRVVSHDRFHMMFRHFPDYPQPWARQWLQKVIGSFHLITIVRDPIERAISAFNHGARYHGYTTFADYFANNHEKNHQSRWLGYDGRDERFFQDNFSMIGITERFNESMLLIRRTLNFSVADMLYVGQRRDTPEVLNAADVNALNAADMNERWRNRMRETDWLDFELYAQAKIFVDNRLDDLPELQVELQQYECALGDFSHPLWGERGHFPIGYGVNEVWAEFTGQGGEVTEMGQLDP
jgi:hypothetical protein